MRVIIYSSDKTSWSLRPFAWLFHRYWSEEIPVSVFGNSPLPFALPDNFTFTSVGQFQPVEEWTTDLIAALHSIKDSIICLMMDDYWLNRQVDEQAVTWCQNYMHCFPEVARFDLCTDRLYSPGIVDYDKVSYLDIIRGDPEAPYHFSYQASLWRREYLLRCIVPHQSPWDSEMSGDQRLRATGGIVLGTRQGPMRYTIAVQRGKFTPDGGYQTPTNAMQPRDVDYIRSQNWIPAEYG